MEGTSQLQGSLFKITVYKGLALPLDTETYLLDLIGTHKFPDPHVHH